MIQENAPTIPPECFSLVSKSTRLLLILKSSTSKHICVGSCCHWNISSHISSKCVANFWGTVFGKLYLWKFPLLSRLNDTSAIEIVFYPDLRPLQRTHFSFLFYDRNCLHGLKWHTAVEQNRFSVHTNAIIHGRSLFPGSAPSPSLSNFHKQTFFSSLCTKQIKKTHNYL